MFPSEGHPQGRAGGPVLPAAEVCSDKSVWGEHTNLSPNSQFLKAKKFPPSSRLLPSQEPQSGGPAKLAELGTQATAPEAGERVRTRSQMLEPGEEAFAGEELRPRPLESPPDLAVTPGTQTLTLTRLSLSPTPTLGLGTERKETRRPLFLHSAAPRLQRSRPPCPSL